MQVRITEGRGGGGGGWGGVVGAEGGSITAAITDEGAWVGGGYDVAERILGQLRSILIGSLIISWSHFGFLRQYRRPLEGSIRSSHAYPRIVICAEEFGPISTNHTQSRCSIPFPSSPPPPLCCIPCVEPVSLNVIQRGRVSLGRDLQKMTKIDIKGERVEGCNDT